MSGIFRNGNPRTMVHGNCVSSNFEGIELLGTARRLSEEDKDYIDVARPALIGSNNNSIANEWN